MKQLTFLFLFIAVIINLKAQTIPVFPAQRDGDRQTKKASKPISPKPKNTGIEKSANTSVIKFLCNADAILYVDGVSKACLKKDNVVYARLTKREYFLKAASIENEEDQLQWKHIVAETVMNE